LPFGKSDPDVRRRHPDASIQQARVRIEERETAEVAAMLDLSEGAVRVRLHRGRQALRALLGPHLEQSL
jgi:DNA-directed RNA polymerase specialized sigma24 family protein